jgi:ribosome-associated translation inhibitor RaiA
MATSRARKTDRAVRQRDERRAAFAESTPKAVKRVTGAATTSQTPMQVRAPGLELEEGLRDYARERTGFKLGKFGLAITRISVRFEDLSGPKGAKAYECRVKVLLRHAGEVVASHATTTQRAAFDKAADAAERAVRRTLEKQARTAKRARPR